MTSDQSVVNAPGEPPPFPTPTGTDGLWRALGLIELPVAIATPDSTIVWCSEALADLASQTPHHLVGQPFAQALGTARADRVTAVLRDVAESGRTLGRALIEATDWAGTVRRLAITAAATEVWGATPHLMIIVENKSNDRRNLYSSDPSLGSGAVTANALAALPTRSTFDNLTDAALRRAQRNAVPVGVMACGLSGFEEVGQRLGREAAETLVAANAARLAHALRGEDLLMYDGAGRYLIVADGVATDEVAVQVGRRLRAAVNEPIVLNGTEVRIGLAIGYTIAFGGERASDLWEHAERALTHARSLGPDETASTADADASTRSVEASAIDWHELAGSDGH